MPTLANGRVVVEPAERSAEAKVRRRATVALHDGTARRSRQRWLRSKNVKGQYSRSHGRSQSRRVEHLMKVVAIAIAVVV